MGSRYDKRSTEDMVAEFAMEFSRIENCSSKNYNPLRSKGTPTWECVARRLGVERWSDVCIAAKVNYTYGMMSNKLPIVVISHTRTEHKLAEIENKYKKLLDGIRNSNSK